MKIFVEFDEFVILDIFGQFSSVFHVLLSFMLHLSGLWRLGRARDASLLGAGGPGDVFCRSFFPHAMYCHDLPCCVRFRPLGVGLGVIGSVHSLK